MSSDDRRKEQLEKDRSSFNDRMAEGIMNESDYNGNWAGSRSCRWVVRKDILQEAHDLRVRRVSFQQPSPHPTRNVDTDKTPLSHLASLAAVSERQNTM